MFRRHYEDGGYVEPNKQPYMANGVQTTAYDQQLQRNAADKTQLAGIEAARNPAKPGLGANPMSKFLSALSTSLFGAPKKPDPIGLVNQAASLGYQGNINPGFTDGTASSLMDPTRQPGLYNRGTGAVRGAMGVDQVDAKLTAGEAVLPVATVNAVGRENIEALIRATTGKEPKNSLRSGAKFATGYVYDENGNLVSTDATAARPRIVPSRPAGDPVGAALGAAIVKGNTPALVYGAMKDVPTLAPRTAAEYAQRDPQAGPHTAGPIGQNMVPDTAAQPVDDRREFARLPARNPVTADEHLDVQQADAIRARKLMSTIDTQVGRGGYTGEDINSRIRGFGANPAALANLNEVQRLNRTGITGVRQANGNISFSNDLTAPQKIYKGADGKPTTNWTDTEEYQSAISRNAADTARVGEIDKRNQFEALETAYRGAKTVTGKRLAAERLNTAMQVDAQRDIARGVRATEGAKLAQKATYDLNAQTIDALKAQAAISKDAAETTVLNGRIKAAEAAAAAGRSPEAVSSILSGRSTGESFRGFPTMSDDKMNIVNSGTGAVLQVTPRKVASEANIAASMKERKMTRQQTLDAYRAAGYAVPER